MSGELSGELCVCGHTDYAHIDVGECMGCMPPGCSYFHPDDGRDHGGSCVSSGQFAYEGRYKKRFERPV